MRTLASLKAAVKKFGAELEHKVVGRYLVINVDAPAGKKWAASDVHCLHAEALANDPSWKGDSYEDIIDRMEDGLVDCDDEECDYCHPVEEETDERPGDS